jgi:hypothetical protein
MSQEESSNTKQQNDHPSDVSLWALPPLFRRTSKALHLRRRRVRPGTQRTPSSTGIIRCTRPAQDERHTHNAQKSHRQSIKTETRFREKGSFIM